MQSHPQSFFAKITIRVSKLKVALKESLHLLRGILIYALNGRTPERSYFALRELYVLTRGRSNEWLHKVLKVLHPPTGRVDYAPASVLGDNKTQQEALQSLRENGFYTFPNKVDIDICDELLRVAFNKPCMGSGDNIPGGRHPVDRFDPQNPKAIRYNFNESDLIEGPAVQKLMSDPGLFWMAQEYFGSMPFLDFCSMSWSTSVFKGASNSEAQMYHFDMDRIKFIKFFLYLTDIDHDSGPHCVIRGTHKYKNPLSYKDGRHDDESLMRLYPKEDFVELVGPKGTLSVVDTSCFHKGKHFNHGNRLIFHVQFSDWLFGAKHTRIPLVASSPQLSAARKANPKVFVNYLSL